MDGSTPPSPDRTAGGSSPAGVHGAYAAAVRRELRTRCIHLATKEAFVGLPAPHEQPFALDEPLWWCDRTGKAFGPDGSAACRARCHAPGRVCYDSPAPRL